MRRSVPALAIFLRESSLDRKLIRCPGIIPGLILSLFLAGCHMDGFPGIGHGDGSYDTSIVSDIREGKTVSEDMSKKPSQGQAREGRQEKRPLVRAEGDLPDSEISVVMVGDILLHDGINKTCRLEDGSYDYSGIFKNVRDEIEEADIAIVNQEVIIGGRELGVTGYPSFNAPFEIADELASEGFDVVCHANNHVYDRGETGLVNCITYWEENHPNVRIAGINDSQQDDELLILEKKGIRVAVLNYTYGTNGVNISEGDRYSVNRLRKEDVIADLQKAEEMADFTIVCPHWGIEYDLVPSDEQREWAELFMENGADLVIGSHPHVIQPVEWIEDEVKARKMLIYYSLGNFVNWTSGKGQHIGYRLVGGMARVSVNRNDRGEVAIEDHDVEALVTHLSKDIDELTVYRLSDYVDRLAGSNEILKNDSSFSKEYCVDLCDEVWGDEWK